MLRLDCAGSGLDEFRGHQHALRIALIAVDVVEGEIGGEQAHSIRVGAHDAAASS